MLVDQLLGIGGLSLLIYVSARLWVVLRAGWRMERADGDTEPSAFDL